MNTITKISLKILWALLVVSLSIIPGTAQTTGSQTPDIKLEQTVFDAKSSNQTLLHINTPGRYSIQVKSKQGTGLTFVDRMAGPYKTAGSAGKKDGRLDLLLDIGTYKIRLRRHYKSTDQSVLSVFPFRYVTPVSRVEDLPYLQNLKLYTGSLEDLQQQAYWIEIKKRQTLRLEMLGRNLTDARLWRDGSWLEDVNPTITTYETIPGRPMTHIEFHHDLNPGLYLLTCYGGPEHKWTKETGEHPFHMRMGIPKLSANGQRLLDVSPFGRDTFEIGKDTNFFQMVREEKKPAQLAVTRWGETKKRFAAPYRIASITKKSRDPWCVIRGSAGGTKQWVVVTAPPGDRLQLDYFVKRYYSYLDKGHDRYWISSIHSAEGRDAIDVTAVMTSPWSNTPVKADVIPISPKEPMTRKVNLLGNIAVFLFIEEEGTYVIDENPKAGAVGKYQLKPFMLSKPRGYKDPPFQEAGTEFELTAGYYVLNIYPKSKGILHFALHKKANFLKRAVKSIFSKAPLKENPQQAGRSLLWPEVKLEYSKQTSKYFTIWLNQRHAVESGIIVRKVPLDLAEALPVTLEPGKSVVFKVRHPKKTKLTISGGSFQLKVNNVPWDGKTPLAAGFHHLELLNNDKKMRLFNVQTEIAIPYTPPPKPVLKKLADVFPILTGKKSLFRNFDRKERKQFLLQVDTPALYRLETTGRMATAVTVRTRTSTSLFNASQNGIGRNALVQQYLKPGDYLVNVQTLGKSKGRAGIHLRRTELDDVTGLLPGIVKRRGVPPDAAVRYRVEIKEGGDYHLETYARGKKLTHRFEDAENWPLAVPGGSGALHWFLPAGTYYYYSLPYPVASRRVTFLKRKIKPPEISGKGPHNLELNKTLKNTWMEDDQRSPDLYRLDISAPIWASFTVTNEMEAVIKTKKDSNTTTKGKWSGMLPTGTVELLVKSPEKNNRQPYTVRLDTKDLIPGLTRRIHNPPVEMNVNLAEDALVDITSFGDVDVNASLMDGTGKIPIADGDDIPGGWNFHISRSLKAGSYRLKVGLADKKHAHPAVDIRMQTREAITVEPRTIPFSVNKKISREVLKIPFRTTGTETLLHVNVKTSSGGSLALALVRDGKLLAEIRRNLYIPLPGGKEYTLLAWSRDEAAGDVQIDAAAMGIKEVSITGNRQNIPAGAVRLLNNRGLSFRFKGNGFYSPLLERPCLPVTRAVEGTQNSRGWLVGTGKQLKLESFEIKSGRTTDVVLNDIPVAFKIDQTQDNPMLLEIKSINTLMGAAVFPFQNPPENRFTRSGMLAASSRTLVGIPGKGQYWAHAWSTAPTPPLISAKNRFDTGERTGLTLTAYPKQHQLDFRSLPAVEARVEPGQSVWLQLKEEPQLLEMTLARGLAAFSWFKGTAVDIAAALEKNTQEKITVKGDILYIVNTGDRPARFRAEKRGAPPTGMAVLGLPQGFENVLQHSGTLRFQLPEITKDKKLFAGGNFFVGRVWGSDGKLYHGGDVKMPKNFVMYCFDNEKISRGFLEIQHRPGLVKIWTAPKDDRTAFMGGETPAWPAEFKEGMGNLGLQPQEWIFSIDSPSFISLETTAPTAMTLMAGEKVLYMSLAAPNAGHQLNHYLSAGTYRLLTRVLPGTVSPGNLTLKNIVPVELDEEKESPMQLIRPGELQVFRFAVARESNVGVGLKTENDTLEARLYDEKSNLMGTGPMMLKKLPPGTYLLVVETHDAPVQYRPIILGTKGSRSDVPDDVIQKYKKEAN
ncbi:MAG: hypothetical protein GY950_31315 [bacterium]|nr:hypothetical protein [bacterium]